MYIPPELQRIIVSYGPLTEFKTVSKEWNDEIKILQKKAVSVISNWYYKRRVFEYWGNDVNKMIRYISITYPDEYYMCYPEFAVKKLRLNKSLLDVLPPLEERKRSNIKNWMTNMPLELDDWLYVGF